jgi:2-dehydropantoate 2-reductase
LKSALPLICTFNTKLLVLVGNNLTPAEIHKKIKDNATGIKKVLFGFHVSGGKKEEEYE